MPADLTKEDIDELERKWKRRLAFDTGDYDARAVLPALSLARAQIEGREAGGELVERLRTAGSNGLCTENPKDYLANGLTAHEALLAADALASYRAENERLSEKVCEAYQIIGALADLAGVWNEPDVVRVMDYFCEPEAKDDSILPWPKTNLSSEADRLRAQRDEAVGALGTLLGVVDWAFGELGRYTGDDPRIERARTVYNNLTTGEQTTGGADG